MSTLGWGLGWTGVEDRTIMLYRDTRVGIEGEGGHFSKEPYTDHLTIIDQLNHLQYTVTSYRRVINRGYRLCSATKQCASLSRVSLT